MNTSPRATGLDQAEVENQGSKSHLTDEAINEVHKHRPSRTHGLVAVAVRSSQRLKDRRAALVGEQLAQPVVSDSMASTSKAREDSAPPPAKRRRREVKPEPYDDPGPSHDGPTCSPQNSTQPRSRKSKAAQGSSAGNALSMAYSRRSSRLQNVCELETEPKGEHRANSSGNLLLLAEVATNVPYATVENGKGRVREGYEVVDQQMGRGSHNQQTPHRTVPDIPSRPTVATTPLRAAAPFPSRVTLSSAVPVTVSLTGGVVVVAPAAPMDGMLPSVSATIGGTTVLMTHPRLSLIVPRPEHSAPHECDLCQAAVGTKRTRRVYEGYQEEGLGRLVRGFEESDVRSSLGESSSPSKRPRLYRA